MVGWLTTMLPSRLDLPHVEQNAIACHSRIFGDELTREDILSVLLRRLFDLLEAALEQATTAALVSSPIPLSLSLSLSVD